MGNIVEKFGALLVYGGSLALRSYERKCIDSWIESLPDTGRNLLSTQLTKLDRYKRLNGDKVLQLFPTGWPNGTPLPSEMRVPLREDEARVAKMKVVFVGATKVDCTVVVVMQNGQLTSLEFSKLPTLARETSAQVLSIQHLRDIGTSNVAETMSGQPPRLSEGFQWLNGQPVKELKAPKTRAEVREFIGSFALKLPDEYVELLSKNNGFSVGNVTVYGVGEVWTVPRPGGPFVVLGNVMGVGDIACKVGDQTEQTYLLDVESGQIIHHSLPFSQSLRQMSLRSERLSVDTE